MLVEKTYQIKGNEPLLLNNSQIVWRVVSGELSIFALKGDRHYLFDVAQGEILFGIDAITPDALSLLAVPLETSQLEQLSLADLVTKIAKKDKEGISLLQTWLSHLKEIVPETIHLNPTENPETLTNDLASLHQNFCQYLTQNLTEEQKVFKERWQKREQLNHQVVESALGELASILEPKSTTFYPETSPLLAAIGAVCRALNITIKVPENLPEINRFQESQLNAIARTSGFGIRRVNLVGNWWQKEHDSLLAYNKEDNSPLALLLVRNKNYSYLVFDPVKNTRQVVTETVAKTIAPNAYMFYPPLPPVVSNPLSLFRFGIKGKEADIFKIFLFGSLATILGTIVPIATGISIDRAIPDRSHILLSQIALGLLAAAFGQAAFRLSQGIIALRVENAADGNLQLAVWDRLLKLPSAFFRQYSSGDLVNRVLAVRQIRTHLSGAVQRTLLSSIFSLFNLALMLIYSFKLALVGVSITLVSVIFTSICGILLVKFERQQENQSGAIAGLTVQLIDGIAKLRVSAAEERAFAVWAEKYASSTKLKNSIKTINDLVSTVNEVLPAIASVLLFWMAISSKQTLSAGTFLAFYAAFGIFINAVTDLSNTLTDTLGIVPLWERIESIVRSPIESNPERVDPGNLKGSILLDRISFGYSEDSPLILDNVTISAKEGEFIAIVGPSGSGKSTLFRLLLGFETPNRGKVYYDNQDLSSLDITAVRRQLGVVLQNSRLQQGSIFENISGGANLTLEEAIEAAKAAGLADDIREMPMGMHTTVSVGGSNLSGGQRQRLLIARALANKPKIILMDEATSALDNRTQAIVTQSLKQLQATRIAIAHRLSTIREADRIYVMDAGRIVQVGSFEELLMQSGLFARLVARQL